MGEDCHPLGNPELGCMGKTTGVTDVLDVSVLEMITCGRRSLRCITCDDENILID